MSLPKCDARKKSILEIGVRNTLKGTSDEHLLLTREINHWRVFTVACSSLWRLNFPPSDFHIRFTTEAPSGLWMNGFIWTSMTACLMAKNENCLRNLNRLYSKLAFEIICGYNLPCNSNPVFKGLKKNLQQSVSRIPCRESLFACLFNLSLWFFKSIPMARMLQSIRFPIAYHQAKVVVRSKLIVSVAKQSFETLALIPLRLFVQFILSPDCGNCARRLLSKAWMLTSFASEAAARSCRSVLATPGWRSGHLCSATLEQFDLWAWKRWACGGLARWSPRGFYIVAVRTNRAQLVGNKWQIDP